MSDQHTKTLPTVAIFCRTLKENDDPFSSDYYWQAYQDLMIALRDRGIDAYLVTDNNTYLGYGTFSVAYTIPDTKTSLNNLTRVEHVMVDLVFDRGGFIGRDVLTINNSFVQKVGTNKIEMYQRFAEFQPKSVICKSETETVAAIESMEGDTVVVKEPESYGGHHVYIADKQTLLNKLPSSFPLLVQEFLDTSLGVPGLATGVHDIRLSMCGGELIGCYVRQAKPGVLHSNVAQGGKMIFMDVAEAPEEPVRMAKEIDTLFQEYPRYYSVDFVNTAKGWKMLEINALLALLPLTDGEEATKTCDRLADYFTKVATEEHARKLQES